MHAARKVRSVGDSKKCAAAAGKNNGALPRLCSQVNLSLPFGVLFEIGIPLNRRLVEEWANSSWRLPGQIAKPRARLLQLVPGHVTEWEMATEHDAQHRVKQDKALGDLARCTGSSVLLDDVIAKRAQALCGERQTMVVFARSLR
jgi:hypothetical protein